jgi:hypothetical protein
VLPEQLESSGAERDEVPKLDIPRPWIDGGDHAGVTDARLSGPVVRAFLERALFEGGR